MKKKLAFVLGGGAARGALQAGALRALFEAGYQPDLVTCTSIGAANAAFLGVHGFNLAGVEKLEQVWKSAADQNMLPTNLWWQTMRVFFSGVKGISQQRIREFAITHGLAPELRFKDLQFAKIYPVATDLNSGCPVIFGRDPQESVLESVLASMSLPPWMAPIEKNGRYLVDGGAVSNLPIEAALLQGATEMIALDLLDPRDIAADSHGFGDFFLKLDMTVENRSTQLELELAQAHRVPVRRISLTAEQHAPLWDFRHSSELIHHGYQLARQAIEEWETNKRHNHWGLGQIETAVEEFLESLE